MHAAPDDSLTPPNSSLDSARRWLDWAVFLVIAGLTGVAVVAALMLRQHADARLHIMDELAQLETEATAQSSLVWRALTMLSAKQRLSFVRMRGDELRARESIKGRVTDLHAAESEGTTMNAWLGFAPDPLQLDTLENKTEAFLEGVQLVFAQMQLSPELIQQRLRTWDIHFGAMSKALQTVKSRDSKIAAAASETADRFTLMAATVTFLAAALFVLRLGQVRRRRDQELHHERLSTLSASEARFRALVQNTSDLILVLEPDGHVRFATPSARILSNSLTSRARETPEQSAQAALEAAQEIEAAIETGAMSSACVASDRVEGAIDGLFGISVEQLLQNAAEQRHSEVSVPSPNTSTNRVFDVKTTDLRDHPDVGGIVLNARDITARKGLEKRLRHQALHDPLTNLPNRRQFKLDYDALADHQRRDGAVLFIDLDGFKLINDSYGHNAGDALLVETSGRINSCLNDGDVLARQGGDEFLVLLVGGTDRNPVKVANEIVRVLLPPFRIDGGEFFVSASVGVVTHIGDLDCDEAAQHADIAMYRAKQTGKARAVTFAEEMLAAAPERLRLETDFRRALERGEFEVHYQPKVGLASGRIESLEALVRWRHPERGLVQPDSFIGFAEETGLISELGKSILEQACLDAMQWQDRRIVVAVNISPIQFRNPKLVREVQQALDLSGLAPELLELEITESAVLGDLDSTKRVLDHLKSLGVRLAIDDFGTGYSNLAHLKHFDVDVLKIDQSFIRGGVDGEPTSGDELSEGAIVEAVIGMAKAFDLHVVAEGIETAQHAESLRELGADLGQGYFFSRPITSTGISALLAEETAKTEPST